MSYTAGTPPQTSGTVLAYSYPQRKVIETALRRAGYQPEGAGSEWLQIAQDAIFTKLSEYANAGFPLWTRRFILLPITIGSPDVLAPYGTVDVLHTYWRILQPWRGAAMTTDGQNATGLFGGALTTDVTIATPNPGVNVAFGSTMEVDTVGVLLGGSTTLSNVALALQASEDGATWTTVQSLPAATYAPGTWTYFDLNPTLSVPYLQLIYPTLTATLTLQQVNFGLANGQDIEIGPLNIDDYYNLPNKLFRSTQANSAYVDRQRDQPVIKIWPTPNDTAFYNGTISILCRRYIEDPGSMTDSLEIPARWYEGVVSRLAVTLIDTLPPTDEEKGSQLLMQARMQRRQTMEAVATKSEAMMWAEERTRAPMRWAPDISPYTR